MARSRFWTSGLAALALDCLSASAGAARAETICGHEIRLKSLIMERASKFHASDKKQKMALGSLIAECEIDGVRYLVSAPGGDPKSPHIQGFIYHKRAP